MPRCLVTAACALLVAAAAGGAQVPQSEYAARRAALVAKLDDGVVLVLGAREPSEDYLSFYQAPSFEYLSGFREPNAALVMVERGGTVTSTLFVQPREPSREVWTGTRLGPAGATKSSGLPARPFAELRGALDSLARSGLPFNVVGTFAQDVQTPDAQFVQSLRQKHAGLKVTDVTPVVLQLRGKKSPAELALIRKAAEITVAAQREAIRAIEPEMNEFEVQGLIEYTFRRNGADRPSFATIVGSGPNSTVLHYNANDRFMRAGDMVVMDIGASYAGYAADVTRTVPVGGTFSAEQRAIYQLVRDAQAAAERQAKLGARAFLMEDSARATLARGLAKLGLIESHDAVYDAGSTECPQATERGCPQWSLFYMHSVGHGIGLDLHDPDQFYYEPNTIGPGSAFTIEPGVYVREHVFAGLPETKRNQAMIAKLRPMIERFKHIGVRIEDDYVATERGVEWVSRAPREIAEIEALMKEAYAGPAARNADLVNSYKDVRGASPPR